MYAREPDKLVLCHSSLVPYSQRSQSKPCKEVTAGLGFDNMVGCYMQALGASSR